jgi:hypothetical protein
VVEEAAPAALEAEQHTPAMGPVGKVAEAAVPGGRTKVPPGGFSSGAFWSVHPALRPGPL